MRVSTEIQKLSRAPLPLQGIERHAHDRQVIGHEEGIEEAGRPRSAIRRCRACDPGQGLPDVVRGPYPPAASARRLPRATMSEARLCPSAIC
jgi:hypothetical protein